MDIEKIFSFLATDYGLDYRFQKFENCFGGNWIVYTHSYYNESGCFTIQVIPQRDEYDFYYSDAFSEKREELTKEPLNYKIHSVEKEMWEKYERIPFHQYRIKLYLETAAGVVGRLAERNGSFFGIQAKNR